MDVAKSIDAEFSRQSLYLLSIRTEDHGAAVVDDLEHVLVSDVTRARHDGLIALSVDSFNVGATDSDDEAADRFRGKVLGDSTDYRIDGPRSLFEIGNDSLSNAFTRS
jgi:hypothetical protein